MKDIVFETERNFLDVLDGKVYAVCNGCGKIICDILENDYVKLIDANKLIDRTSLKYDDIIISPESDYILKDVFEEADFKAKYGIRIIIKEKLYDKQRKPTSTI